MVLVPTTKPNDSIEQADGAASAEMAGDFQTARRRQVGRAVGVYVVRRGHQWVRT